jgi:beta-lactamase regulating signal transducer with metallopeptidase domain
MAAIFEWAMMNSAMALLLAVPAYASSWLKRPALTHALWLLVLLRLVAPPVWNVTVLWPKVAVVEEPPPVLVMPPIIETESVGGPAFEVESGRETKTEELPVAAAVETQPIDWSSTIAALWAGGTLMCIGLAFVRAMRFQGLVRRTSIAPSEWIADTELVASKMRLRRAPQVRTFDGTMTPLLWAGFGRPVLLLPICLVTRIDAERRLTLIAHELAHFRRGDHFVRWLEIAATALFWWNPLVWLARREMREAEELLCDFWVVRVLPDARRAYAAALVDTVDYLSETSSRRPAMPALASGLGEVRQLKRRIVMIMNGTAPRRIRRWVTALGFGIFAAALSISPSFADDDPTPRPPRPPSAPQPPEPPDPPARAIRRLDPERAEQADQIRSEMRKLRETMARLERRLAEIEGRPVADTPAPSGRGGASGGRVSVREAPRPSASTTPAPGLPPPDNQPRPEGARGGRGFGGFGGMGGAGFAGPGAPGGFGGGMPANFERRMDEMQRAIERLSRDLSEMRRSMRDNPGGPGAGGGERRERRSVPTATIVPPAPPTPPGSGPVR